MLGLQDRREVLRQAQSDIRRIVQVATADLLRTASRHGPVRFVISPSEAQIADAARRIAPSESRIHIANAMHRRVHAHATPGDSPDVTALLDGGAVTWSRGRTGALAPYSGAAVRATGHGLALCAAGTRLPAFSIGDVRDPSGRHVRMADLLGWAKALKPAEGEGSEP